MSILVQSLLILFLIISGKYIKEKTRKISKQITTYSKEDADIWKHIVEEVKISNHKNQENKNLHVQNF